MEQLSTKRLSRLKALFATVLLLMVFVNTNAVALATSGDDVYTVSFDAEGGICATSTLTEASPQAGIILPSATCAHAGWMFTGWATETVGSTQTRPTVYAAGTTYYPSDNTTLHAVYAALEASDTYKRVTAVDELASALSVVVVCGNTVLNHALDNEVTAPTETSGKITPSANQIFTLSGDNTNGYQLISDKGPVGAQNLPTESSGFRVLYENWSINNKWVVENNTTETNQFVLRNTGGEYVCMAYYNNKWGCFRHKDYAKRTETALKLYVPLMKVVYASNPSGPAASFASTIADLKSKSDGTYYIELTSAAVTYVSGKYAYLQDATGAVMVFDSSHGLSAGQQITGLVRCKLTNISGMVYLSSIMKVNATVTADADIPAPLVMTLKDIVAGGTAYDGQRVTVRNATVVTGMTDVTSGAKITDDEGVTTFNIINPYKMTLEDGATGHFTGYVSIRDEAYRLYLYEDDHFNLTPPSVTVALSSAGLATFVSDYPLDYTGVDGLEAYIALEEGDDILLKQVRKVPAATGVLLRSTNGATSYEVPVLTATADDVTGNRLVRGEGTAVESGTGPYNYILNIVDGVLGFYRAAGRTVATNRAYLQTTVNAATSRIVITFDDATTAVDRQTLADREHTGRTAAYDMQGRQTVRHQSAQGPLPLGLYIINGHKVIIR